MNTEEALKVLGIPNDADPSEVKQAYQNKQEQAEEKSSLSDTAINRQITELEIRRYEQKRAESFNAYDGRKNLQPSNNVGTGFYFKRISLLMVIPLMAVIGLNLDKISEFDVTKFQLPVKKINIIEQLQPTAEEVSEIGLQAEQSQKKLEQYFIDENLPLLNVTLSIREIFQKARNKELAGQLHEARSLYDDVQSRSNNLIASIDDAIAQRAMAEKSIERWSTFKEKNKVMAIPQIRQLDGLHREAVTDFSNGHIERAGNGFKGVARLYNELIEKTEPVIKLRQQSSEARNRWHALRDKNVFTGKKIEDVDKPFLEAKGLEKAGQLSKAAKSYAVAVTTYENAMKNGEKITADNSWLKKMRSRLAEIEAEKEQESKQFKAPKQKSSTKTVFESSQSPLLEPNTTEFVKKHLVGRTHYNIFHDDNGWTMQVLAFDQNSITIIEENEFGQKTSNTVSYRVKDGLLHLDDSRIYVKIISKNAKTDAMHTCWEESLESNFPCSGMRLEYLFNNKSAAIRFLARLSGNQKNHYVKSQEYLKPMTGRAIQLGQRTSNIL